MKKFLSFCSPAGLLIFFIYSVINRFIAEVPDAAAYPLMILSVVLMMLGIAYNGYCLGKKRSPYDKKK
ncbi:MAG: hypothetical protein Q4F95_06625 [Oscillospiraceae bacterium]|nr:hypothetical protein [Oscillospiraceae bacterium]